MTFRKIDQLFVSTIGSVIHQIKMQSGAGIVATSFAGSEIQKRSYPNSFGGQHALEGYELIEALDLVGNAGRTGEEAVALHPLHSARKKLARSFWVALNSAFKFTNPSATPSNLTASSARKPISRE